MAKRVVFLGAGHAHLYALKRTAEFVRRGYEVVAVAPDVFWYSGLATGMLGGIYPPELDQVDVAALVTRAGGRFVREKVVSLDRARRVVRLASGSALTYDALSITLGSEAPPIDGAAEAGRSVYAVKPVRRIYELRLELETRFRSKPGRPVEVLIAGGGVTAVELAANIAHLAETHGARIALRVLSGGREVLSQLPRAASRKVVSALERRGVEIRRGSRVARLERGRAVLADGTDLGFDIFVNATGLRPAAVMRDLDLPLDRHGALLVDRHLRSVADPVVHGGGDCIAIDGRELPRVGVYAIRQAPVLFENLQAALDERPPRTFTPQRRYLWIMNLGDGTGLAARGRLYWHGRAAFRLKDWIDRRFLREFQT